MKKVMTTMMIVAMASFIAVSCGNKKEAEQPVEEVVIEQVTEETTPAADTTACVKDTTKCCKKDAEKNCPKAEAAKK